MFGSMAGNLMGILYFLLFQFMGIIIASLFLKKEKWGFTLLAGSVLGSFSPAVDAGSFRLFPWFQ